MFIDENTPVTLNGRTLTIGDIFHEYFDTLAAREAFNDLQGHEMTLKVLSDVANRANGVVLIGGAAIPVKGTDLMDSFTLFCLKAMANYVEKHKEELGYVDKPPICLPGKVEESKQGEQKC